MPSADLGTTNIWLALIAISSVVQLLIVVGLFIAAVRFYRRIEQTVDRIKQEHIAPVSERAHKVIDEVEDVMARVRTIDDDVRRTITRVGDGVGVATSAVRDKFWPVLGLLRGLKAGIATLARNPEPAPRVRPRATVTRLSPRDASDTEAEQRFAYEGGTSHARS